MGPQPTDVAWAAGLFDGEGSTSTYVPRGQKSPRRQMAVSQVGTNDQTPAVLVRFRSIVGVGNITGPYRGGLYYWKTTRKDAVDAVGAMLWPCLSVEKRRQFHAAAIQMNRAAPGTVEEVQLVHDTPRLGAAWAAGFFDGEGTFSAYVRSAHPSWPAVSMSLPQASATAVPDTLNRFREIVGVGRITGPRLVPSPWSRLPQYRWRADGRHVVTAAVKVLWPWLGPVKRAEVRAAVEFLDPEAREWITG